MKTAKLNKVWIALSATLALTAIAAPARATLIAYWNFNTPATTSGLPIDPGQLVPNAGAGTIDISEFETNSVVTFAGTTVNAISPDPAGNDMALTGGTVTPPPVNNGKSIVFSISTLGKSDLAMTFAIRRSATGFADPTDIPPSADTVSYSSNGGGSYTTLTTFSIPTNSSTSILEQFDFSTVPALNNNADVRIKITFDGATTQSGNNRIDNVQFFDDSTHVLTGACCTLGGQCQQLTSADCASAGGTFQGPGAPCSPTNPCQTGTGACCTGSSCEQTLRSACLAAGKIFMGEGVSCTGACPPIYSGILINEIRSDQLGVDDDEYFEIMNTSGSSRSLSGLSYIVIGDNNETTQPANSGFVESVTDLSGFTVAAGGHFLVATQPVIFDHAGVPMLNAVPNLVAPFNFENGDNVTHLLVSGFYGTNGQDLDTPDDCALDVTPWAAVIDKIALVKDTNIPPTTTECPYALTFGLDEIGPDGIFVPAHVFRYPDGATGFDAWQYLDEFDPLTSNDTPGQVNAFSTGACCSGTDCTIETRQVCVEAIEGSWKGRDVACGTGNAACQGACCYCSTLGTDPWCTTWSCVITDQETCTNPGGIYKGTFQGDGSKCPPDVGAIDCTPTVTIAGARALFTGTPVGARIGPVRLSSKTNLISSGSANFEIQDLSGTDGQSGLLVFGTTDLLNAQFGGIAEGDKIDIQGTLQMFNGVLELANSNVRALALVHNYGDNQPVAPIVIPGADFQDENPTAEDRESELVKLNCVTFVDPPDTTFAASTNYTVTDGTGDVTVRIVTASPALDLVGATIPTGPCSLMGIFSQSDVATPFDSNYRLLPRKIADIGTAICGPTAACCVGGGTCRADLDENLCNGLGGNFFSGQATCTPPPACLTVDLVRINEIRMDQPSTDFDEYFELRGTPTTPLSTLTYIVIGDNPSGNGGVIESVTPLTGEKIPADGVILAAKSTYSLGGTPDLTTTTINFENDDNMTHMIVENFTGANGDDLDTPDDGVLDSTPWDRILDSVAVVKTASPVAGVDEYYYSATTVGPAGSVSPFHVLRCPPSDAWVPGTEETSANFGNDTPGAANPNVCPCACPADRNADGKVNGKDVSNFAKMILGQIAIDACADINQDGVVNYTDTAPFVDLVLQSQSCSGDFATGVRVVSYNLLQYNGGASAARKAAFKRVLNAIRPDVLAAQELSGGGATDFLNNVLNAADGPSPGGYALASYTSGDEALFYRTAKITYAAVPVVDVDFGSVATTPRPTPWRKLGVVGGNPANDFYVYNTHLKAGTATDDPANPTTRDTAAGLIRTDADTRNGAQVIVAGDLNLYSSNSPPGDEPAWSTLTVAGDVDGQMVDPINTLGIWHATGSFAAVHTQSPYANNNTPASPTPPGAIGGGMDDRFDFVLINAKLQDVVGLSYHVGTYKAFGNDALHFNNDINDAPTIPEGSIIADSLHMAADHIPVVMELDIH